MYPPNGAPPFRGFPGEPLPAVSPGGIAIGPMFQNPAGTNPLPSPQGMPYSQWQITQSPINWTAPVALDSNQGYTTAAYWSSPQFDLRPEIRGADTSRPRGVPIWSSPGKKLFVQIFGLNAVASSLTASSEMYLASREYAHIFDPENVVRISPDADISDQLSGGTNQPPSIIIPVLPLGGGYPVRYWRLELAFRRFDGLQPNITIAAAFY